ncbi:MAG: 3-phosphoshikimate 1-carboxyvinyltransferase, partial [Thiomicrorhabdus sp.]|nr:3-phosphoshikimate 1-carboxyvinyltransferase [Thiomicrorhabdus sp.]
QPTPDGMVINGGKQSVQNAEIQSHHDHRISMAMTIAGLNAVSEIVIDDCANVNTSFPTFLPLINSVGMTVEALEEH